MKDDAPAKYVLRFQDGELNIEVSGENADDVMRIYREVAPPSLPPQILSAYDVARLMGKNANMVNRLARRGKIPSITLPNGEIAYREDEIKEFLLSLPKNDYVTAPTS